MDLWTGLGQAATVAQLVGTDAGGLISMIMQAAETAHQNKKECKQLADRVSMIRKLLPHLQDPEVMRHKEVQRPLTRLRDTLQEALELVTSCQGRNAMYQFVTAGKQADRFRDVQSRIDSYLLVFPFISHIDVTHRLDRIYNILLPNDSQSQLEAAEVAQEVVPLPHGVGAEEFAFAELAAATNNFALDTVISEGRLHDGREVNLLTHPRQNSEGYYSVMAQWTGLGQAATVAQLVGADAGGHISMIQQAAVTARQNKEECEQLARGVSMIAEQLLHLQVREVMLREEVRLPLTWLGDTLREAHELVTSCQGRSTLYQFVMARKQTGRFRDMQIRIDSIFSQIYSTRRLDRIHNIPAGGCGGRSGGGPEKFTFAELAAATNNFALDTVIGEGFSTTVYKGRLYDGREVAIKRMSMTTFSAEEVRKEMAIHCPKHIVRLFGWCVGEEEQGLVVYEYMNNGTLHDRLHLQESYSSPVTTSWKMRIEILLGVSRAIEYLHCYAVPPVIHGDIKSSNVLLDASWVPRVSGFFLSVIYDEADEKQVAVCGTAAYIDPEYIKTRRLKPSSDVYSFGVVMLEVLTGKQAYHNWEEEETSEPLNWEKSELRTSLVNFALRCIQAGELGRMLDRRPAVPEPTPRQLEAVELVAHTAARCLRLPGEDRPAISDVVADLETALELVRCGELPDTGDGTPM